MPKFKAPPLTDAEEARIQAQIASDSDAPEMTDEQLASLRPFAEVLPDLAAAIKRGRPPLENPKQQVTLRIDVDIISAFRATGAGWQGRINDALRKAVLPR